MKSGKRERTANKIKVFFEKKVGGANKSVGGTRKNYGRRTKILAVN